MTNKNTYYLEKGLQILAVTLSVFVITGYLVARSRIDDFTKEAYVKVVEVTSKGIEVDVSIEEDVPVNFSIILEDILDISEIVPSKMPYKTRVPIKMMVPIKEVVSVPIDIPVVGRFILNVPIDITTQINENFEFSGEIDIDSSLFKTPNKVIEINEVMPISTSVTVNLFSEGEQVEDAIKDVLVFINKFRKLFFLKKI